MTAQTREEIMAEFVQAIRRAGDEYNEAVALDWEKYDRAVGAANAERAHRLAELEGKG